MEIKIGLHSVFYECNRLFSLLYVIYLHWQSLEQRNEISFCGTIQLIAIIMKLKMFLHSYLKYIQHNIFLTFPKHPTRRVMKTLPNLTMSWQSNFSFQSTLTLELNAKVSLGYVAVFSWLCGLHPWTPLLQDFPKYPGQRTGVMNHLYTWKAGQHHGS